MSKIREAQARAADAGIISIIIIIIAIVFRDNKMTRPIIIFITGVQPSRTVSLSATTPKIKTLHAENTHFPNPHPS